jgi:hypothetical protein
MIILSMMLNCSSFNCPAKNPGFVMHITSHYVRHIKFLFENVTGQCYDYINNKQQKEAPMGSELQDAVTIDKLEVPYNPNLLVTYKAIAGTYAAPEEPTYLTSKVTEIEWDLHNGRTNRKSLQNLQGSINSLEDLIVEWYDPNYSKEDVLVALCEHFGIDPVKQIEVQGTVTFTGTISIPMSEIADFDLSNVSIDVDLNSYDYDADLTVDEVTVEEHY